MDKRKKYAIASGAALLLSLGGTAILAGPALADTGTAPSAHAAHSVQATAGHEDGTNDGETADDVNEVGEAPGTEQADGNEAGEAPGTETDDDHGAADQGHEDGTQDGETADDAGTER